MSHECQTSICIDKPSISKLTQSMQNSTLFKQTAEEKIYPERPLYRTEFGPMTWKVLHRIAATYPEHPLEQEKELAKDMFKGLARFFPCVECAVHFQKEIKIEPPKLENNKALSKWVCYQHNQVNQRLGKKVFDCNDVNKLLKEFKV